MDGCAKCSRFGSTAVLEALVGRRDLLAAQSICEGIGASMSDSRRIFITGNDRLVACALQRVAVFSCRRTYNSSVVHLLRKALFWLVLLALPLQGFALGQMPSCGTGSMEMEASASQALATPVQAGAHADVLPIGADERDAMGCDLVQMSMAHCAVSVAGAAAPAMTSTPFVVIPKPIAAAPQSQPGLADAGFFTDAPERPPRLLTA